MRRQRILIVLCVLVAAESACGAVLRVDGRANGPVRDGASWKTAYLHPQDAMDAASPADEVWVAEGRYAARGSDPVVRLRAGVRLLGGFGGWETRRAARDPSRRRTVLDGRGAARVVVAGTASTLDGFVVVAGRATGPGGRGGGVLASGVSDFDVDRCTFLGNAAPYGGAACFDDTRGCSVTRCVFDGNAAVEGGAIRLDGASTAIARCVFRGNAAAEGGAVYCSAGSPDVDRCRFIRNAARHGGGAVYIDGGSRPDVRGCEFRANSAAFGGAVYCWASSPRFAGCTFSANRATCGGGAARSGGGAATRFDACAFTKNAAAFGGGVSSSGCARTTLARCTFRENAAEYSDAAVSGKALGLDSCAFAGCLDPGGENPHVAPVEPGREGGEIFITRAPPSRDVR